MNWDYIHTLNKEDTYEVSCANPSQSSALKFEDTTLTPGSIKCSHVLSAFTV